MKTIARYFDGRSSQSETVRIEVYGSTLLISNEEGGEVDRWLLAEIRDENASIRAGDVNLSIATGNPARLISEDITFIDELEKYCPNIRKKRAGAPGWWRPVAVVVSVAIVSVGLFFTIGLPGIASFIANVLPVETRQNIGLTVEDQMIRTFSKGAEEGDAVCNSIPGQDALEKMIEKLSNADGVREFPLSVVVIKSKTANAFALPGGHMVVMSALIDRAKSANALAGVLSHEISHVEEKHPTRLFVSNLGIAAILSLAFGDITGGTIFAGAGQLALGAAYSRDFERTADNRAIDIMSTLNFDISEVIPLLQSLVPKKNVSSLFSLFASHPDMEGRIAQLVEIGSTGESSPLTKGEWLSLKSICKKAI
ncbi:MAG: M48 family metallopeptidase [Sneathiella sp.]